MDEPNAQNPPETWEERLAHGAEESINTLRAIITDPSEDTAARVAAADLVLRTGGYVG